MPSKLPRVFPGIPREMQNSVPLPVPLPCLPALLRRADGAVRKCCFGTTVCTRWWALSLPHARNKHTQHCEQASQQGDQDGVRDSQGGKGDCHCRNDHGGKHESDSGSGRKHHIRDLILLLTARSAKTPYTAGGTGGCRMLWLKSGCEDA